MTRLPREFSKREELVGRLLNEDLDAATRIQLNDLLAGDIEAQKWYVQCLDLEVAMRRQAQSLDDEDFATLEVQAALDDQPTSSDEEPRCEKGEHLALPAVDDGRRSSASSFHGRIRQIYSRPRHRVGWIVTAAIVLVGVTILTIQLVHDGAKSTPAVATSPSPGTVELGPAHLSGAVGARWAGAKLELLEGQQFEQGQRLELVEGLAELGFLSGARIVVQGPAILQIGDESSVQLSVGRLAATVPKSSSSFNVRTPVANLSSRETEFGAEVDVDGSLVTQVYSGDLQMQLNRDDAPAGNLQLASRQGLRVDGLSGRVGPLEQPNGFHFVRYLPRHQLLINLADLVAGGDGLGDSPNRAYHEGINLADGRPARDYGPPVQTDGEYHKAHGFKFVDGVFIPDGKQGPVQVDSVGRLFSSFPATAGDCWGGVIMARRPKEEDSLPLIRLEFHGDNYGYVNWLHIASKPEELSPQGYGLIGMHSNCGITFDLHAIRAQHPNKKMVRFRSSVGNLESKLESYAADAWVLVDGQLRYHRKEFSRENGPESIDLPLADRDRFLVLVVTDTGAKTAYDWVAFGDP